MGIVEPAKVVGPWRLVDEIGQGGNATVWRAIRDTDAAPMALKILNTTRADKEPYHRFVREIEFLRSVGDATGLLPLIDAYLPESPTPQDRAWLAMPIANPIRGSLSNQSLEVVVRAIAEVASTLARLKTEHGIAHRDIKPQNLYELDGSWLVGDFGLIHVPDLEELTKSGRPLGPAHYTAYELIRDPLRADPHPADVYSLAKTLWVLATDQRFPPDGHQAISDRGLTITDLRPHPQAAALDRLIDNMTQAQPHLRPKMEQVVRDLTAWQELAAQGPVLDTSELGARFRAKKEQELAASDELARNKEFAYAAVRRLQELAAPINDALTGIGAQLEIDAMDDKLVNNTLRSMDYMGAQRIEFRWQRCTRLVTGQYRRYQLRVGRSLELTANGNLIVRTLIDVGFVDVMNTQRHWRSPEHSAPVGSIEAETMLQSATSELLEQLGTAIEVFVEHA